MIPGRVYCCARAPKYTVLYVEKMMCQSRWYLLCQSIKTEGKQVKLSHTVKLMSSGGKKKLTLSLRLERWLAESIYRFIILQDWAWTGYLSISETFLLETIFKLPAPHARRTVLPRFPVVKHYHTNSFCWPQSHLGSPRF